MAKYHVDYFNEHTERWSETYSPVMPIKHRTEADRLASTRSGKSFRLYRVRQGMSVLSYWKRGNEIPKEKVTV